MDDLFKELKELSIEELDERILNVKEEMANYILPNGALDGRKAKELITLQNTINLITAAKDSKLRRD